MSFLSELRRLRTELAVSNPDPLRAEIEDAMRGKQAISTTALLDMLGLPKNTGAARRVAKTMRALGFVPIKSRRLVPGGFRDTVCRGWARPLRAPGLVNANCQAVANV